MSFKTSIYGKYFLLDRIAVGGMAEVFKAKTFGVRGFERLLVIKRILPHLSKDDEFIEMFIDEAKISVGLTHANICQVTDLGKIADNYFIAMEYIDGKDLRAILKKSFGSNQRITIPMAIYIAGEVCKGLEYAHTKTDSMTGKPLNVIHRDISPQNVMVSYNAEVKIVDFGIAKTEFKLNRTQAGVLKGKFGYMSPEQAAGLEVDFRTDVFSAGIILYETLTGRRLFLGDTDFDTLEKIKDCFIPPPSKYNPSISPEFEKVILKALAKEREDRFENAHEFQAALAKIFYTQHASFSPRELRDFLRSIFAEEIEQEQESLRRALDALPADEVAAATSAAEAADDRLIDSDSSRSSSSGARKSRISSPIGMARVNEGSAGPRRWLPLAGKILAGLIGIFLGVALGWKWLHPTLEPDPTTQKTSGSTATQLASIQITSEPPGAVVQVNDIEKGKTPVTLELKSKAWHIVRFQKDGFLPREEQIFVTQDQSTYGPYKLDKDLPKTGVLLVTSTPPGAAIFFDGDATKLKTPETLQEVSLNVKHRVGVKMEGYRNAHKEYVLKTAKDEVRFTLEKDVATLRISVRPADARVRLDGNERGHVIENLKLGKTYDLQLDAPGYDSIQRKITLSETREELVFELKRKMKKSLGSLSMHANPWAKIIIDGKPAGISPILDYELTVGEHTVVFQHPDFKSITKKVKIQKGKNPNLIVDFRS